LVRAILGILMGCSGWNLFNLLRILNLEGIVNDFRWFSVVSTYIIAFFDYRAVLVFAFNRAQIHAYE
jgi:hypothetical protein